MRNEIIDDKLISKVGQELVRIGLFVPISEIEQVGIKCYDEIREAHSLVPSNVTVDAYTKDDKYYGIMTCVICANLIARTRLENVQDGYEATSVLALLQKYLDRLAEVAGTERQEAPLVFSDIISHLKIDLVIDGAPSGEWTARVPRKKGGSLAGATDENNIPAQPKINPQSETPSQTAGTPLQKMKPLYLPNVQAFKVNLLTGQIVPIETPKFVSDAIQNIFTVPQHEHEQMHTNPIRTEDQSSQKRFEPRVCSNCTHALCGDCKGCGNCDEIECSPDVTVTINYHGMCFGFRIDPSVVGINRASYTEDELKECRGALKHAILRASRILSKKSDEMFSAFNKQYLEGEGD